MTRKEETLQAAEKAYPYKGGTKGAICKASIPVFVQGAEWADKTMIERAIEYFSPHIQDNSGGYDRKLILERFRKAMEKGG